MAATVALRRSGLHQSQKSKSSTIDDDKGWSGNWWVGMQQRLDVNVGGTRPLQKGRMMIKIVKSSSVLHSILIGDQES